MTNDFNSLAYYKAKKKEFYKEYDKYIKKGLSEKDAKYLAEEHVRLMKISVTDVQSSQH